MIIPPYLVVASEDAHPVKAHMGPIGWLQEMTNSQGEEVWAFRAIYSRGRGCRYTAQIRRAPVRYLLPKPWKCTNWLDNIIDDSADFATKEEAQLWVQEKAIEAVLKLEVQDA